MNRDITTFLNYSSGLIFSLPNEPQSIHFYRVSECNSPLEADFILNDLLLENALYLKAEEKSSSSLALTLENLGNPEEKLELKPLVTDNNAHRHDFNFAKSLIKDDQLKKMVVFSHSETTSNTPISKPLILKKLLQKEEGSLYFLWHKDFILFGRTPEVLFKVQGNEVSMDSLAGTSQDQFQDNHVEENLWVEKHLDEVARKFSLNLQSSPISEKRHGDIKHLYKELKAKLPESFSIREFIQELAPTPALGGYPRENFLQFFKKTFFYQQATKSLYYGGNLTIKLPDGIFSLVLIRGAYLRSNLLSIEAGGGIVAASSFEEESKEVELKKGFIYDLLTN